MHFMNPVPVMKLVEGIRGLQTSDETFRAVRAVAEKMGKTFVEAKDQPGFAVNRILMPMINEAVTALHEGVASVEDIDTAMKLGTNQPMGPLTLADFIGLDTCLAIMEVLHEGLGDSKYRPSPASQAIRRRGLARQENRDEDSIAMTASRISSSNPHEPGIRVLKIARREALNALNTETLHELKNALTELSRKTRNAASSILTGEGDKSFIAGADIAEMKDKTVSEGVRFAQLGHEVTKLLELMPKPTIAAVNGFALGGGTEMAISCDFIVASEKAVFGQPEVGLGIIPGFGATIRLAKFVGLAARQRADLLRPPHQGRRSASASASSITFIPPTSSWTKSLELARTISEQSASGRRARQAADERVFRIRRASTSKLDAEAQDFRPALRLARPARRHGRVRRKTKTRFRGTLTSHDQRLARNRRIQENAPRIRSALSLRARSRPRPRSSTRPGAFPPRSSNSSARWA